jgi:hypothetical protein
MFPVNTHNTSSHTTKHMTNIAMLPGMGWDRTGIDRRTPAPWALFSNHYTTDAYGKTGSRSPISWDPSIVYRFLYTVAECEGIYNLYMSIILVNTMQLQYNIIYSDLYFLFIYHTPLDLTIPISAVWDKLNTRRQRFSERLGMPARPMQNVINEFHITR